MSISDIMVYIIYLIKIYNPILLLNSGLMQHKLFVENFLVLLDKFDASSRGSIQSYWYDVTVKLITRAI